MTSQRCRHSIVSSTMTSQRYHLLFGLVLFATSWLRNDVTAKSLVLIGGALADENEHIWNKIIELAGGNGVARIGIVTAASANPVSSATYYRDMLTLYGANETYFIPVFERNEDANSDPVVVENILRMTGFMFGGGDQARVIKCFYNEGRVESPALAAIRQVYNSGGVIAGTSAGMACQCNAVMTMGGVSYNALLYGAFPDGEQTSEDDLVYDPYGGIQMISNYAVDQHFSERGREGRLIRLISDTRDLPYGVEFGVAADEDTAIVVTDVDTPAAVGEVIGSGGVFVVDISKSVLDETSPYFNIRDVLVHYLSHGDRLNMTSRQVTFDYTWKQDLAGREPFKHASTSDDIFGGVRLTRSEFVRVGTSLVASIIDLSTFGTTSDPGPVFRVTFYRDEDTRGVDGISPVTGQALIAYSNMWIEIGAA